MIYARRSLAKVAAISVVVAITATSCNPSRQTNSNVPSSSEPVPVDVSMRLPIPVADTAFAPYYLCIDAGICEKHGINLTLEPGSPELNPVKMLSQGTDEFALVGGPEILLTARSQDAPIVGISLIGKDANFVTILTPEDSDIRELNDLQDKKVGFFYGHISTDVLRMLFEKENIQVQEVDVGFDYSQLIAGNLDAQWAFRTTAGITLPARGVNVASIDPADYGISTQGFVLMTNENLLSDDPELVQSFVNAITESVQYSLENEQEAIDSTVRRDPEFSQEVGEAQLDIYRTSIENQSRVGFFEPSDMEKTKDQMLLVDLIPDDLSLEDAYTNQFVENSQE